MGTMFPSDFLWGAATAGYQVEGDICNNDWDFFTSDAVIHARVARLGKLASPPEHFRLRPDRPCTMRSCTCSKTTSTGAAHWG